MSGIMKKLKPKEYGVGQNTVPLSQRLQLIVGLRLSVIIVYFHAQKVLEELFWNIEKFFEILKDVLTLLEIS